MCQYFILLTNYGHISNFNGMISTLQILVCIRLLKVKMGAFKREMDSRKLFLKSTYSLCSLHCNQDRNKQCMKNVASSHFGDEAHPPGQAEPAFFRVGASVIRKASELLALKMVTEVIIMYKRQSKGTRETPSSSSFLPKLVLLKGHQY